MKDILERLEDARDNFPIIDERPDRLFEDAIREIKQLREDLKVHQGFSELWYFVMDEAPLEFEDIVTDHAPSHWLLETGKLRERKRREQRT